ncbi:MAG: hypothetical protein M1831_003650 [Alyxoria varia]|nr:MAG: hypothetical protein M1831_003650 [Alyxoria varia]
MQIQTRKGIYHGLPVLPNGPEKLGLSAIITGANGISGSYLLRVLAESPQRWKKIWCLSRRPPVKEVMDALPEECDAEHVCCDFLSGEKELGQVLKDNNVSADYVFFFAYIQPTPKPGSGLWSNAEELVQVNTLLLRNFLGALPIAGITPKRIMLQTGAKNYGLHLGPTKLPLEESDPRITLEPNFYYPQEDTLEDYCRTARDPSSGKEPSWVAAMPAFIMGAVPDAAINAAYPLAVYASVCRHLNEPLRYPYDITAWQCPQMISTSRMNAYLEEWMCLVDGDVLGNGEKVNADDGAVFIWESAWPKIADWYHILWRGPDPDPSKYIARSSPHDPPPRGYGGPTTVRTTFTMSSWAKQPHIRTAWRDLAQQKDLTTAAKQLLEDDDRIDSLFGCADGWLGRSFQVIYGVSKRRKMGWFGYVDSVEALKDVMDEFAGLRMIPQLPKVS